MPALHPTDMNVLVVEDDEINLEVAQELLEQLGVGQVHVAPDGARGLKKLKTLAQVDAVVVDIYMPDMDGIEFIAELTRLRYPGKVIIVSGVSVEMLQVSLQLAREGGVNVVAAMQKPLHIDALAQALGLAPA